MPPSRQPFICKFKRTISCMVVDQYYITKVCSVINSCNKQWIDGKLTGGVGGHIRDLHAALIRIEAQTWS